MCKQSLSFARDVRRASISGLLACLLACSAASADAGTGGSATDAPDVRRSRSSQYAEGGRAATLPKTTTDDEYRALVTSGKRLPPGNTAVNGKPSGSAAANAASPGDFWIYYADVQLYNDDDHDGYYRGIDLLFDADTVFEEADVYAVLYLSYEGGPWNEYAVTDTFRIFGATSDDEYVVTTDLDTGYPRGNYDLLLDLYDTFDGQRVATFGPEDTSSFGYLPLEDFTRDDPRHGDTVVVVDGGGAVDLWTILAGFMYVLAVWLVRRRQRQSA